MKKLLFPLLVLCSLLLSACKLNPVDERTLNPGVSYADFKGVSVKAGDMAPDFSLPNADNKAVSLNQFKNKQAVMLLFYRGEWCPYCIDQLDSYQALLPELDKYQIQLIAISPDETAALKNTQRQLTTQYIFLSDADLKVTRQYGIGNVKSLPHPAIFLVDKQGKLRWYYASQDHKSRPSSQQIENIIQQVFR